METVKQGYIEPLLLLQLDFAYVWLLINTSPRYHNEINLKRHHSGEIPSLSEDLKSLSEMSTWPVSALCPIRTTWWKQRWSQEWG